SVVDLSVNLNQEWRAVSLQVQHTFYSCLGRMLRTKMNGIFLYNIIHSKNNLERHAAFFILIYHWH
ncbi:Hypothetical protein FKW44_007221, partial [Caligus rogercresseyi]